MVDRDRLLIYCIVFYTEGSNPSLSYIFLYRCVCLFGVVVQLVRAPPCHGGSYGFESRQSRFNFLFQVLLSYSFLSEMIDFHINIIYVSNALKPKILLHILLLNTCENYPHIVASQPTQYILRITDPDSSKIS